MIAVTTSDYYEKMLEAPSSRLPIHEDDPQPGRYRVSQNGKYAAVAIWREGESIIILRDGEIVPPAEHSRVWTWCAKNPISPESYDKMISGDHASDPIYAQIPETPPSILSRIQMIGSIPSSPSTSLEAERLADAAHILKTIENRAADTEKELTAPLKAQIAAISAPWKEVAAMAKAVRDPIMAGLAGFLMKKNEPSGVKGQMGKAISLRTDKTVQIDDLRAAASYFVDKKPEAFESTVMTLARAEMASGHNVPGCKMIEKRRAQ